MRRKVYASLLCLVISASIMACGTSDNEAAEENAVEAEATTEYQEDETELESTEEETTEEDPVISSAMGSVNREDFVIVDVDWGYSNLVDYVEATGDRMAEVVLGYHSVHNNGQIDGKYGEDAVTNKGIRLGSTKEEVVKAYGTNGYDGPTNYEVFQTEGHYGVTMMQLEYLESPTHHYYLFFGFDENDILIGMISSCWIER